MNRFPFASRRSCLPALSLLLTAAAAAAAAPAGIQPLNRRPPAVFEPNRGQADPSVRFLARGPGYLIALDPRGSTLVAGPSGTRVRTSLAGANPSALMSGEGRLASASHYIHGRLPRDWRTGLPHFERVLVRAVYPGIDLLYYAAGDRLEYDFQLAPGADPARIRMAFQGVESVTIDSNGDLVLGLPGSQLRHLRPQAYQPAPAGRSAVAAQYRLLGPAQVGIELGAYDRQRPVVIDPVLSYATYLGGAGEDRAYGIAVDGSGNVYLAGETYSANFPVRYAWQPFSKGYTDVFVSKLDPTGSNLLWSTYIGGADRDSGRAIALDPAGNVYVTGLTRSANFPVTTGAYRTLPAGGDDVFVTKLNSTGAYVSFSTYLGGSGSEQANGIAIDSAGSIYLAGSTASTNFPLVNAAQAVYGGGTDAFIAKLNAPGSALVYSTYLGGSGNDGAAGLAVDAAGSAHVAGQTQSSNFPARNALQGARAGGGDAFAAKLTPAGTGFVFSTYYGGSGADYATDIALDSSGSVYLAGATYSIDFPVTSGAFQPVNGGGYDGFVSKLSSSGTALIYSTYLGGANSEEASGLAVDGGGCAYVTGYTGSGNFPTLNPLQAGFRGAFDAFLSVIAEDGGALRYSGYFGGSGDDRGKGVVLDGKGNAFVAGITLSFDLEAGAGALSTALGGSVDAFVFKARVDDAPRVASLEPSSGSGTAQTFTLAVSDPDGYANLNWVELNVNTAASAAAACLVHYARSENSLYLENDAGSAWLGPIRPGSGTLQNSQCTLNGTGSSVSVSGTSLTLNAALSFKPAFAGARSIFVMGMDNSGLHSGWQQMGTWTVPAAASNNPSVVSLNPSSGTGSSQTFTLVVSDPNGYADLNWMEMIVNTEVNAARACVVHYVRGENSLYLQNDMGSGWLGPVPVGSGTLENSQCMLNGAGTTAAASGTSLTLNAAVSFKPAFAGAKKIFLLGMDYAGLHSGWQPMGTWTVPAAASNNPSVLSLNPSSGTGSSQTFTLVVSDPNGYADLNWMEMIVNTEVNAARACVVHYVRGENSLYLQNDAGSGWLGPVPVGSGTLENSQCMLNGAGTTAAASGTSLTLNAAVSFKPAFAGAKKIFLLGMDYAGLHSGWQQMGTWTVPASSGGNPVVVSLNPSSGAGSSQTFTVVVSDPNGAADLSWIQTMINTEVDAAGACFVHFVRAANSLYLQNDAGSIWLGPIPVGSGTLQNSQCTLNGSGSSAVWSGTSVTLNVSVTFKPVFRGTKKVFVLGTDYGALHSGWQQMGVWTVP